MRKFIKFCLVGLCNTIITFCVFYLLSEIAGINYMVSSFIGYIAGVVNSFILNRRWTFHNNDNKVILQFIRFISVNAVSLLVNLLVLYISVEYFHLNKLIAQMFAILCSISINFVGSVSLVFINKKYISEDK